VESQFFTIITGLALGIIGSLLSFYYPEILSKNITPLSKSSYKITLSFLATLGSIVLICLIEPAGAKEWVQCFFIFLFYVIAWVDGYSKIIPNRLLLMLLILASINLWYEPEIQKVYAFLTVIFASLLIYWIGKQFASKRIIGWGDVKLTTVLALFIGWEFILVIYMGVVLAGMMAVIGVICKRLTKSSELPLTPFLFIGLVINSIFCLSSELNLLSLLKQI
jgi:Flp pilus assembly protein protease CpaA|tara:strand:- start:30383 stop:31048 length:666 start_codon:yes stop_codon:yes gene_type:complete